MTRIIPHRFRTKGASVFLRWPSPSLPECRRAEYTAADAQQVHDWLNGRDQPLQLVPEDKDPWMVRWERRVGVKHLLE